MRNRHPQLTGWMFFKIRVVGRGLCTIALADRGDFLQNRGGRVGGLDNRLFDCKL